LILKTNIYSISPIGSNVKTLSCNSNYLRIFVGPENTKICWGLDHPRNIQA